MMAALRSRLVASSSSSSSARFMMTMVSRRQWSNFAITTSRGPSQVRCQQNVSASVATDLGFSGQGSRRRIWTAKSLRSESSSSGGDNMVKFHLSDIGEGIKEVTVKEWYVKVGDRVAQFDQICEVQSDKASVTITSRYDGVIRQLYFKVDDIAQTGDALVEIQLDADSSSSSSSDSSSDSMTEEADAVKVPREDSDESFSKSFNSKALAAPAVRRLAVEHRINISDVQGSGRDGRVLKEDVLAFLEVGKAPQTAPKPPPRSSPAAQTPVGKAKPVVVAPVPKIKQQQERRQDKTEPLKGIAKAMVKTMTEALTIPHFGYCDEIDMGKLVQVRKELQKQMSLRGGDQGEVRLSFMPFVLKACSLALNEYPTLNAHFDAKSETVTIKGDHNIGVAMDTAQGLLVPNVKAVQNLSVYEIAAELNRLQQLGLAGKLGESDLKGGTFSISNIGSIGGTYAKPIILPPQVVIGALGKMQVLPRFADPSGGSMEVIRASLMNVSWSADHRVLDGATVSRFSNLMKAYLENPSTMLLDLR